MRQEIDDIIENFRKRDLNYDIDLVEKEKKILVKLKREILLKIFQTYHLTDDELDQFIFTRYKTSLEWDDFFYKANLNYPKFIHDELIYRIYNLQMFTYDNLFIFKQYYDKLYMKELQEILPPQYQMYVTKELLAFFEYDNIDPFTYGEKQLLNYLKFYDNNRQYELKIIKER